MSPPAPDPTGVAAATDIAVAVSEVGVTLGRTTVLQSISFTLARGRILGLLGANGAGKTTLMQVLMGLRAPATGVVRLFGQPLPWRDRRDLSRLGCVPQETALYDELTVLEQLSLFATVYDSPNPATELTQAMELLGLQAYANTRAGHLSGGMRRRVVLARALVHQPQLLLIDEPTLAVDAETRQLIWTHLRSLKAQGRTVVIATNYVEEARAVCDEVVVLRQGRMLLAESLPAFVSRMGMGILIEAPTSSLPALRERCRVIPGVMRVELTPGGLELVINDHDLAQVQRQLAMMPEITHSRSRTIELSEWFRPEPSR